MKVYMSEALEKLGVEEIENRHVFTIKRNARKWMWLFFLLSGVVWFWLTREWNTGDFTISILLPVFISYSGIFVTLETFTRNTIVINGDELRIIIAEFSYYPRWRIFVFKLSEIDKVVPILRESSFGNQNFVNVIVKSGEPYNITYGTDLSGAEAKAIAERVNNSLNRFLLPASER